MQSLKKIGLFLAVPLLGISIFMGVSLWSLQQYFGDSSHLKQWLVESELYPAVRAEIVKQTAAAASESEQGSVTLSSPVVTKALEKALTTQYLQSSAEQVLDGTYTWLEGDTPKPNYNIDVDPIKKVFAASVAQSAQARLNTLPDCVLPDQATTTDPFTVNCNPPASITAAELQRLQREIRTSQDFLPTDITADTNPLGASTSGSTPTEAIPWYDAVSSLPTVFQWLKLGPIVFLVLGALSIAAIIGFSPDIRRGIRRASMIVLTSSLALGLSSLIMVVIARSFRAPLEESSALYAPMLQLFKLVADAVSRWQFITCFVLVLISGGVLLVLRFTRPSAPVPVTKSK